VDEEAALGLIRSIEEVKSTAIADWQPSLHLLLKSLSRELEDAVGASRTKCIWMLRGRRHWRRLETTGLPLQSCSSSCCGTPFLDARGYSIRNALIAADGCDGCAWAAKERYWTARSRQHFGELRSLSRYAGPSRPFYAPTLIGSQCSWRIGQAGSLIRVRLDRTGAEDRRKKSMV
jgi:hypothetical protein